MTIAKMKPSLSIFAMAMGLVVFLAACSSDKSPTKTPQEPEEITGKVIANYDSSRGLVRLTWNRSDYPGLTEYLVYRTSEADPGLKRNLVARVPGEAFADTAFSLSEEGRWLAAFAEPADSTRPQNLIYTVHVRKASEVEGPVWGSINVGVASPDSVRTVFGLRALGASGDTIPAADSIRIVADFRNSSREIRSLEWMADGANIPLKVVTVSARTGHDTLVYATPSRAGNSEVVLRAIDASGDTGIVVLRMEVIEDHPVVRAGEDTVVVEGHP